MKYRYNPDCSCPRCRAHALYGPAVLITIGVLFLLDQIGHVNWMAFHNTWPALLIVMGLILFLEHNASAAGHVPRGYLPAPPVPPVQGYTPPPGAPQQPVPPPASSTALAPPDSSWRKPDDPEVHHG